MSGIKAHKTPVMKTGSWDGSKALVEAKNDVTMLRHMHAWVNENVDPSKKAAYKFPHHMPGVDTPALIEAVNQALVRLQQSEILEKDKLVVEAHLRAHRVDAGLSGAMSEAEVAEAVKYIKDVDDLKKAEASALLEAVRLQEKSNLAEWLESRLHMTLTHIADEMFGDGRVTRDERKVLSGAIGTALDAYHQFLQDNGPQLFTRAPWEDAPKADGQPVNEATPSPALPHLSTNGEGGNVELIEADQGMFMPLMEKAVRRDGTIPIKVIQAGWGSSGYYPAEVLERDGPKVFTKGMHMYWNHPTYTEESERPERDLNDLAAVLVSDARWNANGPKGAGLYADAKVFEAYQKPVDDMAENIGVSIRALGKAQQGMAEGRSGVIINELLKGRSIDFVTAPGAGGEIVTLFEAVRTVRADKANAGMVPADGATRNVANQEANLEEAMDLKELTEKVATLETNNQTLVTNNARLSEALALRDAREMVKETLIVTNLPEITIKRLVESLSKNPPMKDGALDVQVFAPRIAEAVKAEAKYLESLMGVGQIRGLGESQTNADDEDNETKIEESLTESFSALGLGESTAKIAAKGRS